MIDPPKWSHSELSEARDRAEESFATRRRSESLETYQLYFDGYKGIVKDVLERTLDLSKLQEQATSLLRNQQMKEVVRYLCGPPISNDDLNMLVRAKSLHATGSEVSRGRFDTVIEVVRAWHDRRRFPWVDERRSPEEHEKDAAVLATTALLAMRKTETRHRMRSSESQELSVETELRNVGFEQVPTRKVATISDAPRRGEFCRESMLGSRKADFIVGLRDGRTMAIECKVSSSAVNSIKRLNNDAAAKATVWRSQFGTAQLVPVAVLDGVYALKNLVDAQAVGLAVFWAHDLAAMTEWIRRSSGED